MRQGNADHDRLYLLGSNCQASKTDSVADCSAQLLTLSVVGCWRLCAWQGRQMSLVGCGWATALDGDGAQGCV
jgi:hypothetical protein